MKKMNLLLMIALLFSCCKPPNNGKGETEKELRVDWSHDYELAGYPEAVPLIEADKIFMIGDVYITAMAIETGAVKWQTKVDEEHALRGQKILHLDDQIVVAHYEAIRGWQKETGEELWEFVYTDELEPRLNGIICTTDDGFAYSALKGRLFVLNKEGQLLLEQLLQQDYSVMGVGCENGKLFAGQRQTVHGALTLGRVTALDAATGDSLWAYDTENGGFTWAAPIVENGIVYAGAIGNSPVQEFVALDAETGEVIWRQTNKVWAFSFILGPEHVYVNTSGTLAALNKTNGAIVWRYEWSSGTSIEPVYLEGYVYHSDHGRIFVLDAETGELVHEEPVPPGGSYFWHLAVSSDKLFAQTSRQLIAYQPWHLREE
ncbi:MAG: PQQ-binding-like beta-propeller repeat protein [Gracilimonas sp.]|uniref:PQQ-binding-like beta-propeller repeat protein n=1 Tax=Gracilimonas sp. TaxID=1974203 RepID=UPI0037514021|nr:PQQ-binding-like beta-propeller repeat protein [Gracilimonas sp.]